MTGGRAVEGGGNQKQERGPAGCVKTFKATLLDACHCVMSIQRALFGTSQASSYFRPSQGARAVERALGTWLPFSFQLPTWGVNATGPSHALWAK